MSRTAELHAKLVAIQTDEKHHKLIGSMRDGRRLYLDEVCRSCPSRRRCKAASVALADLESKILSRPLDGPEDDG